MIVCWVATLGLLTGCAGEDLTKKNFERTTVPATELAESGGGQGSVPSGPIDDPALELATLRTVDACGLLSDDFVGNFNFTPQEDFGSGGWGECSRSFVDVGGKPIRVSLELGEGGVFPDQATGNVAGLPLVQLSIDDTSCISTAVTNHNPGLGISLMANYEQGGGDACQTSYLVLEGVVEQLRANPPQLTPEEGSLLTVDLCESFQSEEFLAALGEDGDEADVMPSGLHFCMLSQGRITAHAYARVGWPVAPYEGTNEIELVDGLTAVQEPGASDMAECSVSWNHRELGEEEAEILSLHYYDYASEADVDTACERVTELAKAMVKTLP
jgi:hypothetical protein